MKADSETKLLLVDDDSSGLRALEQLFSPAYSTLTATAGQQAVDMVLQHPEIGVVVMDIRMPGVSGIEAARLIREHRPEVRVVFHTGFPGDFEEEKIDSTEQPYEFVVKGESISRLRRTVRNGMESYRLRLDKTRLLRLAETGFGMIGRSPAMQKVFRTIHKVAPTDVRVMILGETGTGKELVARAMHNLSPRRDKHLAVLNCNHKSVDLVESELFGHVKGAFTGAVNDRIGLFEYADGGSVFLDEIGDLDITSQAKLLRITETGEYGRMGEAAMRHTDTRLLCATHRLLEQLIADGRFREDLYYRLRGVTIELPPLRERREDIAPLVRHFADRYMARMDLSLRMFDSSAMDVLVDHDWPGNVRDLQQIVETLLVMSDSPVITADDVRDLLSVGATERNRSQCSLAQIMREHERREILKALERTQYNLSAAARELKVDRSNLRKKIGALGIDLALLRDESLSPDENGG